MRVVIQLDRERELRFDGMALANLERQTGLSILKILSGFGNRDVPFHVVLAMLYAGLQHELPGVPEEQILHLVDAHVPGETSFERVMHLAPACASALSDALPKVQPGKNAVAPESSRGSPAGIGTPMSSSVST